MTVSDSIALIHPVSNRARSRLKGWVQSKLAADGTVMKMCNALGNPDSGVRSLTLLVVVVVVVLVLVVVVDEHQEQQQQQPMEREDAPGSLTLILKKRGGLPCVQQPQSPPPPCHRKLFLIRALLR